MKKIAIFPGYYLPHIGGLETVVKEFSNTIDNYEIIIFAPRIPKESLEIEKQKNITIYRYPAFEIIPNYPIPKIWTKKYWYLKNKIKANMVMTHTRFFINSYIGYLFSKKNKIPLYHVEHGSAFVKVENIITNLIAKIYDYTIGKKILKKSKKIISISNAVKEFLVNELNINKEKIITIYRGIDFKNIDKIDKFNFNNNKMNLIFVGRLYKWKGVENSIKAILSLPEKYQKKIQFNIVGDGEDIERLKNITNNNKNIIFWGSQPFDKTIGLLKGANIYVHSAYPGGGLATTLIEAMYTKNIIVASPNEGAKEIIDDELGILLKNNSPNEIKKGIIYVIDNINNFNLNIGYKKAKNLFSWNKNIKKYYKIFEEN